MWHVTITPKSGSQFKGQFETKEEAESWVAKHKRKGRDAYTIQAAQPFDNATDIKKVKGPFGKDVYRFTMPAEYTVEYKELGSEFSSEVQWQILRDQRNKLLVESDKTMLPDFPLATKERGHWVQFRQYLRDLPKSFNDESIHRHKVMDFKEYCNFKHFYN